MGKINARKKGSGYELQIIKFFKDLGWGKCASSRSESRALDAIKVDLVETHPFYIQCKAVERFSTYHDVLDSMPEHKGKLNLLFHKKNRKGTVVAMELDTFEKLLKLLIESGQVKPKC